MTKNFSILKDFNVSKNNDNSIIEKIEKIEKSIKNNEFDYVYINGRIILEQILSDNYYKEIKNLEWVIKDMDHKKIIPSKVKNALYSIKQKGNEDVHYLKKSNQPYLIQNDIFSCVEFLKQIFIVIKFFAKEKNKNNWLSGDDELYKFNSDIYFSTFNTKPNNQKSEVDVKPNIDQLESKLKGMFELITSDYSFLIPTYQREYTWSEKNVEIFLEDIKDRSKDKQEHYMGTLAISVDNEKKFLRLIDGQQRITTSLLLIKSFINKYEKSKDWQLPEELLLIKDKLDKKYINSAGKYGTIHNVKKILSGNITSDKDFTSSNAYKNYYVIEKYLNDLPIDQFDEFYTTFVYYFVISEIRFKNDLRQEIQIFENLNSKGMELSQWDLIKNYIYKNIDFNLLVDKEQEIEKMLNKLFIFKSINYFGNSSKKFKKLSDFFIFYSRIKNKLIYNQILLDKGKIHKIFAKLWPKKPNKKFLTINSLRESLIDASKYFEIYLILESKNYLKNDSPLFALKLYLENMSIKDVHFPLIINTIKNIGIWEDVNLNKIDPIKMQELLKFIKDLDKYITRLLVVNNMGQSLPSVFDNAITDKISKSHKLFIEKIQEKGKGTTLPRWTDFKKELKNKNDWQQSYAICVLRTLSWDNNFFINKKYEDIAKTSLEYIFPQKVKEDSHWFVQSDLTIDKFNEKKSLKTNKLGNFLILSKSLNSKRKNDFGKKVEEYKKMVDDKLLYGKINNYKLMDLTLKDTFDFSDIDERSNQLAEIIAPLYKLSFEK